MRKIIDKWKLIQWKRPPQLLLSISLCLIPIFLVFDQYVAKQQRALRDIKEMISLEEFDLQEELSEKKWKLEKINERKIGDFCKISYQIECQEPLLLEEIKVLLHHPELFSNLISIKSHFCFYEKILLDRSENENPHHSTFKVSWCCYTPSDS